MAGEGHSRERMRAEGQSLMGEFCGTGRGPVGVWTGDQGVATLCSAVLGRLRPNQVELRLKDRTVMGATPSTQEGSV